VVYGGLGEPLSWVPSGGLSTHGDAVCARSLV